MEDKIINMIKYARKSLMLHNGNVWIKKEGNPLVDVTMGSYDEVQVCELVEFYFLSKFEASGWYKKRRALQGWRLGNNTPRLWTENGQDKERYYYVVQI